MVQNRNIVHLTYRCAGIFYSHATRDEIVFLGMPILPNWGFIRTSPAAEDYQQVKPVKRGAQHSECIVCGYSNRFISTLEINVPWHPSTCTQHLIQTIKMDFSTSRLKVYQCLLILANLVYHKEIKGSGRTYHVACLKSCKTSKESGGNLAFNL